MRSKNLMAAAIVIVAGLAAGCSSAATSSPPASVATAPSRAPAAAGGSTIMTATVGSRGTLIVASNGMTLYTFSKDTANSGTSACTAACIAKWPALTVPAGSTPTAASGVAGKIGTIKRPDDGSLQVTYNGLPLYFFSGDQAAGDSNGVYTGWSAVKP